MEITTEYANRVPLPRVDVTSFAAEASTFALQRDNDSKFPLTDLPPMDDEFFDEIGALISE